MDMPNHGFARKGKFELIEKSDTGFVAKFLPCEAAKLNYPFDYTFLVSYEFEELSFRVNFELQNHGADRIPWCAGHHFYFTLPWHEGLDRSNYQINLPCKKAFRHAADGSLSPVSSFDDLTSFDDPELSDRIHTKLTDGNVSWEIKMVKS